MFPYFTLRWKKNVIRICTNITSERLQEDYVKLNPQWHEHHYAKLTILPFWACPLAINRKYSWSRLKRRVSGLLILTGRLNRHCIDPSASRHDTEDRSACKQNKAILTLFYKHFKWSDHMCTAFRKSIFTLCIYSSWMREKETWTKGITQSSKNHKTLPDVCVWGTRPWSGYANKLHFTLQVGCSDALRYLQVHKVSC